MPRPRSDIRPRIIAAARSRFLVDGVDGASLRGIAQAARTNIGMIYYYFPSKEDLFLGVVEDVYGILLDDFAAALDPQASVEERIRRLYNRFAAISTKEFEVIRIMIREVLASPDRLGRLLERFKRGHIPLIIATFVEARERGIIDDRLGLPVAVMSGVSLGAFPQLVRRLVELHAPQYAGLFPSADELARAALDVFWNGLGSGAELRDGRGDPDGQAGPL